MTTYVNPGLDASGNGNNWTTENINYTVSSSTTYDVMTDVPTLTSATTANFATLNPVSKGTTTTLSNANLNFTNSAGSDGLALSTIGVSSGKWYCEVTALGSDCMLGVTSNPMASGSYVGALSTGYGYYQTGSKYNNGSATAYGSSYTTNDVIGIALDLDAGTLVFYKNNVSQGTAFSGLSGTFFFAVGNGSTNSVGAFNFGQRPFAYTPPTGYVALNTFNLPTPTIGATASSQANKYMDVLTYTGDGTSSRNITGLNFQPDLVWNKVRSSATSHALTDAVRQAPNQLSSNSTGAEVTDYYYGGVSAFLSNGFTAVAGGGGSPRVNESGQTYVAWNWKANGSGSSNTSGSITSTVSANTTSGFSVVTYTGNGTSGATVGHGLGVAPKMIIVKSRSLGNNWIVYHASNTASPATQRLILNSTAATATFSVYWNNTAPTSSVFSLGSDSDVNASSNTYVAYCFAEVAGFSKFGSYTGNGSTDGTFVYTGFKPKYVLWKRTDAINSWIVKDGSRNPYNAATYRLYPDQSYAEDSGDDCDFVSNGFKIRSSGGSTNASGGTYIYMAFAENPFKFSLAR